MPPNADSNGGAGPGVLQRGTSFMKKMWGRQMSMPITPGTPHDLSVVDMVVLNTPEINEKETSAAKLKRLVQQLRRRDPVSPAMGSASFVHHGEDAMATGSFYHIVADGISNSAKVADLLGSLSPSAILARSLVHAVEQMILHADLPTHVSEFEAMVKHAIRNAQLQCRGVAPEMGSTLLVAYVARKSLFTFCMGDSKALVVRKGRIVYETLSVVKEFNVPSIVTHHPVRPQMFVVQSAPLRRGDLILSFSDGFGDNVYKDDLLRTLAAAQASDTSLSAVCLTLLHLAQTYTPALGSDDNASLPFSAAAAMEYVARAQGPDCSDEDVRRARQLSKRFDGRAKQLLARQLTVQGSKRHYSLAQLYNMANLQKKKPDDISIALLEFRG
ncbi:Aste57867_11750 [Aphanomyces stellatus]|uniref:Protein phosphatase n=1 Tax=Aphanomyces stellatus TaxID=120398 RepID=A0A485KUA5_9STRA|nr:hypothetical protein As57867_011705 [Aphanomyces stellatus]VFT88606.1 Aste57867_11750 [Aphanomyces stellatus]